MKTQMRNIKTPKQFLFFFVKPIFPVVRSLFVGMDFIKAPKGRQDFPLGFLKDSISLEEFENRLKDLEFFYEKMAFVDPDEILGMRKLDKNNLGFQYHIRIYKDNEVRGHYEKTPEDSPVDHFNEVGFESRHEDFISMVGEFLK